MSPRRAARVDANQAEIVEAFRKCGWWVVLTHQVGQFLPGFPDLLCVPPRKPCVTYFVEVKRPGEKLNANEQVFGATCPAPYLVVRTVEDVLSVTADLT